MTAKNLYDKSTAKAFYEERYREGYMDDWPVEKKQRVFELIRTLGLPETGEALDFGCGNGVFTHVLKQALPGWNIHGCDISAVAVNTAAGRFPECHFFVSDDLQQQEKRFDLLFTHHVLEHVYDIGKTISEINNYLKSSAHMLHILPCGNKGSFEQSVCALRTDGINTEMENRFFYEDEGHVRRLTTDRANELFGEISASLKKGYYSHQLHGAIEWISRSSPAFIKLFADPAKAIDDPARERLKELRKQLLKLYWLQLPAHLWHKARTKPRKKTTDYAALAIGLLPRLVSLPVYSRITQNARNEWKYDREKMNGSEMYLLYEKR